MPRLNYCADCGTQIAPQSTRCRPCWGKTKLGIRKAPIKVCINCGVELPRSSQARRREDGRCWDCHVRFLDARPRRTCSIEGCNQPHEAKGLCAVHYKMSLTKGRGGPGASNTRVHRYAAAQPCQVCGYDKLSSEVNRIDRDRGYVAGNVTAVCRRCHAEITAGVTPHPNPLRIPWLMP